MTESRSIPSRLRAKLRQVGLDNLAGFLAILAMCVGLISTVLQKWVPVSDMALIEMHVRDVPFHLPLVGAYSRFGWSHPGPAQYLLLSVPYRLMAGASWSLPAATLIMNIAAVVGAWRFARSIDESAGRVVLLGAMALVAFGDPASLRSWWNPSVGLIVTFTLVIVAWGTSERRAWPTFALLPLATLLIQSHVGYAAVTIPVVASGLVLMVSRRSDREPDRETLWWHACGGAALAALMWLPPLIDQIRNEPGNLSALLHSGTGEGKRAGIGFALRLLSENLGLPPAWAGRDVAQVTARLTPSWVAPVLILIPIGALFMAVRDRSLPGLRALTVAGAATGGAMVGATFVHGDIYWYLLPWFAPVIAALVAMSSWVLIANLPAQIRARSGQVISVATVLLAIVAAVTQIPAAEFDQGTADAVESLSSALIADADGHPVFINTAPDFTSAAVYGGVVLAAERSGLDVRVPEADGVRFGSHRAGGVGERIEYLVAQPQNVPSLRGDGWKVVAEHDPFTAREHRELSRLRVENDRLYRGPASAETDLARLAISAQITEIEQSRIVSLLLRR